MGGTMRLGLYPCHFTPGTLAAQAYGVEAFRSDTGTALS